ncbi:hypothetical protein TEA_000880 [Camellia sinensis var. sinensis]|uniref:P-type ATPase A domain-containing protein n=1 Tax=Camellia sinensis var. sinensis TaxID=542762 RepID=A0A4S4F2Y2_CAMSN|nr:hypothetical protein TEA_000880 [Camellia sinensis var. sinensis]
MCGDSAQFLSEIQQKPSLDTLMVFARGVDGEAVVLMAARASRVENQDAIDAAIVGTLADPKERKPPDWQDFVGIITLLFINSTISFIEENNARNAAAALMGCLAPKAKVLRDGKWSGEYVVVLVPGDVVSIKLGDIIPADARLLEGDPLKIDQSALTGESLPVTKSPGDGVYSGSTCKQGEIEAVVIATGVHTFFGKAAHLVDSTNQVGHFQKVFAREVDGEAVVLMAARASRVENQDAIDAAIVGTLADPKEARASIQEVHFLPFNLTDKRTALMYIDSEGSATILCLDPYSIYRLLRIDGLGVGVFLLLALRISVPKVDSWDVVLVAVL